MPGQRASTIDDLPKRSSLMRVAGVSVLHTGSRSVDGRGAVFDGDQQQIFRITHPKHQSSTRFVESLLKEYCTVANVAGAGNSRRTRTQSDVPGSERHLCIAAGPFQKIGALIEQRAAAVDLEILGEGRPYAEFAAARKQFPAGLLAMECKR